MELAQVQVELNQDEIKEYIQKQIDEQIRHEYIFVDVKKLSEMMNVSRTFMEEHILQDPRVKLLERRRSRMRLYLYPEIIDAVRSIADSW